MADNSIINFKDVGKFAKPIDKLIEKVSSAIGVLFEPTRIRREAKAKADARSIEVRNNIEMDMLLARAKIKTRELGQRALSRFVQEEARAQQNMEDVVEGATRYLKEEAKPEAMDDDWLTHFFGKSRQVSNKEMQDLWSRILAGEANRAGSFSKRTVDFVSTVSKSEADDFSRLCQFVWRIDGNPQPLIYNYKSGICGKNGMNFAVLANLDSLGLIHFDGIRTYTGSFPRAVRASYYGELYQLGIPETISEFEFDGGYVLMAPLGRELARVVQMPPLQGVTEAVLKVWRTRGIEVGKAGS